jgi:hypothetical protein
MKKIKELFFYTGSDTKAKREIILDLFNGKIS